MIADRLLWWRDESPDIPNIRYRTVDAMEYQRFRSEDRVAFERWVLWLDNCIFEHMARHHDVIKLREVSYENGHIFIMRWEMDSNGRTIYTFKNEPIEVRENWKAPEPPCWPERRPVSPVTNVHQAR